MSVGAVIHRTGYSKATELGGLYRSMPITCFCCIVGAASISAFPLFSGFVSKSMVMSAAAEEHQVFVWLVLLFAAAGVFHHAGIKIPFFAFFSHDGGHRVKEAPPFMLTAMVLTAAGCIIIGCFPEQTIYPLLPYDASYQPYTTHHVVSQFQLLFFSALAFCLLLLAGIYPAETRSTNVDADGLYRKGLRALYDLFDKFTNGVNAASERLFIKEWTARVNEFAANAPMRIARHFGSPEAQKPIELVSAAGAAPVGLPVLVSVVALAAMVVFVF
jgi:multicomponent Na+:H+ antiporter subunit D